MLKIEDADFHRLVQYIYNRYGIDLSKKRNLIEGRLTNTVMEKGYTCFADYIAAVLEDKTGKEATVLVNKLTTNHTFFMREANHFLFFRDKVLPYLLDKAKDNDLRIWSAGCSSGEEPYTLAMLMQEFFEDKHRLWDTKILATDISVRALEAGEKGVYPKDSLDSLSPLWIQKYFTKFDAESYKISDRIRNEVIFRVFNLMDETFPFKKKFHTIFCRNVMIYFDQKTKIELIRKFYNCTEPGGYLFIGHSETIPRDATGYKYVMPAVFRKEAT